MMSGWSPRRGSEPVAVLLLLALVLGSAVAAAAAAPRLRPAPGADAAWSRHAAEDLAWAAAWPADWAAGESLAAAPPDSLAALLAAVGAVVADDRTAAAPLVPPGEQVRDRWRDRGHLACRVRLESGADGPVLTVDPGPRYRVGAVTLEPTGDADLDRRLQRHLPAAGEPCTAELWHGVVRALLRAAGDAGRPFARWRLLQATPDPATALVDVRAAVATGDVAVLDRVDSSLDTPRARRFLARASGLRSGRPFRQRDLILARSRLQARGLWRDVRPPVVWVQNADTVGVHWPVTPHPRPNRFAAVLGLSRDEEERTRLSGQVELELGNIAGTGRRLAVDWSDDGADRAHLGLSWLEPLALGTPLDLQGLLDQEVLADVHTRFRLDGRVRLPVAGAWGLELGVGRDRSTYPAGAWSRSSRRRTRAAVDHRRLDPLRSGWAGVFAVESARRAAETRPVDGETASSLQEERQTLIRLQLDAELWLGRVWSVGLRGFYAGVNADARDLPLSEQERLGGARTLRGYREDQFPGDQVGSAQFELRLGRPGRSRLYTFLDLGYVRRAAADGSTTVVRPRGYGVGIETAGPGGDVSLAVGFPDSFGLDEAKLHVSLLRAF